MTKIYLVGEVASIKNTTFENETITKIQFINENEMNGGLEILEVKISKAEHLPAEIKKGDKVNCPISLTSMGQDGSKKVNTYYRTTDKVQISK